MELDGSVINIATRNRMYSRALTSARHISRSIKGSLRHINHLKNMSRKLARNNSDKGLDNFYKTMKRIEGLQKTVLKKEVDLEKELRRKNSILRGGQTRRKNRA